MNPTPKLKTLDAILLVAGSMIGSGIFVVSSDMARSTGGAGWLMLAWLLTGLITLLGALSYGELAGMMPKAGGQYVYLKEAYNPLISFLYGWTAFLVIQCGTIAAVAVAFAKFSGVIFPQIGDKNILLQIGAFKISAAQITGIISILFLTWLNTLGLRYGRAILRFFTISKLTALFALIVLGLLMYTSKGYLSENFSAPFSTKVWVKGNPRVQAPGAGLSAPTRYRYYPCYKDAPVNHTTPTQQNNISISSEWKKYQPAITPFLLLLIASMVGSLFSSDAWNSVTFIAPELEKPEKSIPQSLFVGTLLVTGLYLLANLSYLAILPFNGNPQATDVIGKGIQFADQPPVAVNAAFRLFGQPATLIMAILIMISTFGCNNGLILSSARLYQTMASDGLFFKQMKNLNKNSVPAFALWIQAIWSSILCLSGKYGDLLDYVIFAVLLFYILTIAGIFILRIKKPDANRPYKVFAYPFVPALYIFFAAIICVVLLYVKPLYSWPGLIICLSGLPVYYLWKKINPTHGVH